MGKGRLEAFSDGVLAIIITIMVLELKTPHGSELHALVPLGPVFCGYALSFTYVAIYWNNHHHLLHTVKHVTGGLMWANLHLLFWLSLLPFITGWVGEYPDAAWPAALYGVNLLVTALAWLVLQGQIIRGGGTLAKAIGRDLKGKVSPIVYILGIGAAFWKAQVAELLYATVALLWVVPDRRIAQMIGQEEEASSSSAQ